MQAKFDYMARVMYAYGRRRAWNAFAILGAALFWVTFMKVTFAILLLGATKGPAVVPPTLTFLMQFEGMGALLVSNPLAALFMAVIVAPLVEETLFRLLPLTYMRGRSPEKTRAVLLVVCGILFGMAHGSSAWPYEVHNVLIQGVIGVLLGVLYLKNGPRQSWSYFSCVFVHASYNFILMALGSG